jgi:hypothetical protein
VGENENFLSVLGVLIYDGGGGEAEKKGKKCLSIKCSEKSGGRKEKKSLLHDGAHCMNNEERRNCFVCFVY